MLENELLAMLGRNGLTIAVAESCTGGRVCDRLTDVPGSSMAFMGGVVAYSNDSKIELLGVSWETIKAKGAVSAECAMEMARGVARAFDADIGISVTGIAGPGGGSQEKPVGLVFIGVAVKDEVKASRRQFSGDREAIKAQATEEALRLAIGAMPDLKVKSKGS